MSAGKMTLIIAAAVVLIAVVAALILNGMGLIGKNEPDAAATEGMEDIVPATIPADGNPDDATCKGSYTVSDEEVASAADTVVATIGDDRLTNSDLQIYYWMHVQQYLNQNADYLAYFGLDYTQPLDTQLCPMGETQMTWQQFFLDGALKNWQNYQSLANESLAQGYEISPEIRADLDGMAESMNADAQAYGFADAEEYLAYNVGRGSSVESYVRYLELYYQGYAYFMDLYKQFQPTQEDLEAYYASHEEGYVQSGITKEGKFVDVRHILIMPEGADGSNIRTETFPDEAWAVAKEEAENLLQQWKDGEATEESFGEMANTYSDDAGGNVTNGGLYTQVTEGQMVENFENWCFDESRKPGDVDIVETEFGYHIMYFVSSQYQWEYYVESDYIGEKVSNHVLELAGKSPIEVKFSDIKLGNVSLG